MFKIYDGRTHFWQWDSGQKLITTEVAVGTEVHFESAALSDKTLVTIVKIENGRRVCTVPDEILMYSDEIKVYVYVEDNRGTRTVKRKTFMVKQRAKPLGYARSSSEVYTLKRACKEVMAELVESGELTVDDAFLENVEKRLDLVKGELSEEFGKDISAIVDDNIEELKSELNGSMSNIVDGRLEELRSGIEESFTEVVEGRLSDVKEELGQSVSDAVSSAVNDKVEGIKEEISDAVSNTLKDATDELSKDVTETLDELSKDVTETLDNFKTTVNKSIEDTMTEQLNDAKEELGQSVTENLESFKTEVNESITDTFNGIKDELKEEITESIDIADRDDVVPRMTVLDKAVENDPDYKFAYDFAGKYDRLYMEKSGGGWNGKGGGTYNKCVLTSHPYPVYDPDTIDYEVDENGAPCGAKLNTVPLRWADGHILVPGSPSEYASPTDTTGKMQAISQGYYEEKTAELKAEMDGSMTELKDHVNRLTAISTKKQGNLVIIDDISATATHINMKGLGVEYGSTAYVRGINCVPSTSIVSASYADGRYDYASNPMTVHPPKKMTYMFSCDFVSDGGAQVAITVKPDGKTVYPATRSGETSGTLYLEIPDLEYTNHVHLMFYSNFSSKPLNNRCEFYNIVFAPVDWNVRPGTEGVSETTLTTGGSVTNTFPVPNYRPIVIHTIDDTEVEVEYTLDMAKHFATQEQMEASIDAVAEETLTDAKTYADEIRDGIPATELTQVHCTFLRNLWGWNSGFNGSYESLTGKPTIPSGGGTTTIVQSQLTSGELKQIRNINEINSRFDGTYASLLNKPTFPDVVTTINAGIYGVPDSNTVYNYMQGKLDAGVPTTIATGVNFTFSTGYWYIGLLIRDVSFVSLGVNYISPRYATWLSGNYAVPNKTIKLMIDTLGGYQFYIDDREWTSNDGTITIYAARLG